MPRRQRYLRESWNGVPPPAGTLTGPDANGYYTATLTGSHGAATTP